MSSIERAAVVVALLALATPGGPIRAAEAAGVEEATMTRERALADLGSTDDLSARQRAAFAIAEVGTMADMPVLVDALRDPDTTVRTLIERAMWAIWSRSGDAEVDRLFAQGLDEMREGRAADAVRTFTRVIELEPDFAEGWNKRATLYYHLGEYERSLADCDEVMKRNPYHFGALSGYGLIYLAQGDPDRALRAFEQALGVNPNLEQIRATVELLREVLAERRRSTI